MNNKYIYVSHLLVDLNIIWFILVIYLNSLGIVCVNESGEQRTPRAFVVFLDILKRKMTTLFLFFITPILNVFLNRLCFQICIFSLF